MTIVSPVMTFDIGALAPTNPYERGVLSAAMRDSTDYVADILDPQFTTFVNRIQKLEKLKDSLGYGALSIEDCLLTLSSVLEYEIPLRVFNEDEDSDAYIFYDKTYYCNINKDGLNYPPKFERYMKAHFNSIRKVHKSVKERYEGKEIDDHVLLFTNFFVTLRNRPFACWNLNTDEDGNVFLDE